MHSLKKDIFENAKSHNIELPPTLSWKVTGDYAPPNEDVNSGKDGHRMWKTGDLA